MDQKGAFRDVWQPYAVAVALITVAASMRLWPLQALGLKTPWVKSYPAVIIAALHGGFVSGLVGTLLNYLVILKCEKLLAVVDAARRKGEP